MKTYHKIKKNLLGHILANSKNILLFSLGVQSINVRHTIQISNKQNFVYPWDLWMARNLPPFKFKT